MTLDEITYLLSGLAIGVSLTQLAFVVFLLRKDRR
jgi:hypothetical protein